MSKTVDLGRLPPPPVGVHHVGMIVRDFAVANQLLGEVLGLPEVDRTEGSELRTAFFRCGGTRIETIELLDPGIRSTRLGENQGRIEHIAFEVDDIELTVQRLSAIGIRATAPPRRTGDRSSFWTRPETTAGVILQFVQVHNGRVRE